LQQKLDIYFRLDETYDSSLKRHALLAVDAQMRDHHQLTISPRVGWKRKGREVQASRPYRKPKTTGVVQGFWIYQPLFYIGSSQTSRTIPTTKGLTMILKSLVSPGPQWRLLPVEFVISGLTGERTEVGVNERYWLWDPACQ
jgi:hypothetical protein